MRARRKQTPVKRAMRETLSEGVKSFKKNFKEELGKIAVIIQIMLPAVFCFAGLQWYAVLILCALLWIMTKYISELSYKLNNITQKGIPVPEKRYTKVGEDGEISLEEVDAEEAILYLCEIEDYLEMKGLIKHGK